MNKLVTSLLMVAAVSLTAEAEIIKQWDFNTPAASTDFNPLTGTLKPTIGTGTPAQTSGGVGQRFGNFSSSTSSDPNTLDNTMWRIGTNLGGNGFPEATNANKTAGVQFMVNSSGYQNLSVSWDQENSQTASRYWRVQYTINGVDWIDHETVVTAQPTGPAADGTGTPLWQHNLSANFTGKPGVDNNPNFGFRLVSEFQSTAIGSGTNAYVANRDGSGYSTGGTMWIDMVTVNADPLDLGHQRPQISEIADYISVYSNTIPTFAFTVSDAETAASSLTVSATCSNPTLITNIALGGSGNNRTITLTPEPGRLGSAAITIRVTDGGGLSQESSFFVTIVEPKISHIPNQGIVSNAPVTINFSVVDLPGDSSQYVFTGTSSNTQLVENSGITFGPASTNSTVTINVVPGVSGQSTITLRATSAEGYAQTNFVLTHLAVVPTNVVVDYNLTGLPSSGGAVTAPATTVATGLTADVLSRGPSLRMAGLANGFSADHWNNPNSTPTPLSSNRDNAIATGDFFQFAITVGAESSASLATLDVSMRRSAIDAPRNFEWQYSFDDFATPGVTISTFQYLGRSSGTAPTTLEPYQWMTTDTAGQNAGNPISTIFLFPIDALQNVPPGTKVTFRLYGWGRDDAAGAADSNTVALGRVYGPKIQGTVANVAPNRTTLVVSRSGNNVQISWPATYNGTLQSASTITGSFSDMADVPVESNGMKTVTVSASGNHQFFRLRQHN